MHSLAFICIKYIHIRNESAARVQKDMKNDKGEMRTVAIVFHNQRGIVKNASTCPERGACIFIYFWYSRLRIPVCMAEFSFGYLAYRDARFIDHNTPKDIKE